MTTKDRRGWWSAAAVATVVAAIAASCGGTGGGGGTKSNPEEQFVLNSNNNGRLTLVISPDEVDANKSDRIGLTAILTDNRGNPVPGIEITFFTDLNDVDESFANIRFIPGIRVAGRDRGTAVTDQNGQADIIAVAGSIPTGTGAIVGTAAIFAQAPTGFGLLAQQQVTLLDVGFLDAEAFSVIPTTVDLVEPAPGAVVFFNLVGGVPPYILKNEVSGVGTAVISQHCLPGCTESGGVLCIGSSCQQDEDCNLNGSPTPAGVCVGPISRCLASCAGTNCAGSRCEVDADCNDGSPTPSDVCKDSGQSVAYIVTGDVAGTHQFTAEDSTGTSVTLSVSVSFICGNGVARGDEQCDLGDLGGATCGDLGFQGGGVLLCDTECKFDTTNCIVTPGSPGGGGTSTPGGPTPTGVTPTPTPTGGGGATPTAAGTPGPGVPSNLALALLSNGSGDNGNGTFTTVVSATVTDINGNPVPDGTSVSFTITPPTDGAIISSPSATNTDPPCDVSNFEADTGVNVLNQPGVAHTCVTFPSGQVGSQRTINAVAGAASDVDTVTLPALPP